MSEQNHHQFERILGKKEVFALAFGAMIGWGWIVLTGTWVQTAGSIGAILSLGIGAIIIMFIGLAYAELCAAMPHEGGEHIFSYRAMGHSASFLCTWAIILGYVSVVAFEAVALPTVVDHVVPNYQKILLWNVAGWDVYLTWALVGMVGTVAVTWINLVGVQTASKVQTVVTALIVLVGVAFVLAAPFGGSFANLSPMFNETPVEGSPFPALIAGMLPVLMMVPFMFVGFDVIPQAASEINMPAKSIGKMLLISVFAATVFYCAIVLGVGLALDESQMSPDVLSTPQAMQIVYNSPLAAKIMVLAGLAGIITSWNAFFIGGSRAIYAMAQAKLLPAFLAKLHPKYKTPTNAILLIAIPTFFAPLLGRKALLWFVNAGSLAIVIAYFMVCISFLVLRRREPNMPRPFRVKNGTLVGFIACLLSLGLIYMYLPFSPSALSVEEWVIFWAWMLLGLVMYLVARKQFGLKESDRIMRAQWEEDEAKNRDYVRTHPNE